ncbi:MAG: MBL fold metallo-hydrolase [Candidatus Omnitrophica bacterium]|nr:MBL fold metallo-hydrolase [Candidatus Omnitrophota bacterium]
MILKTVVVGSMQANCYIFGSDKTKDVVVIDPGDDYEKISTCLNGLNAKYVINTHGHIDHIGANTRFNLPILIHRLDNQLLKNPQLNLSFLLGFPFSSPEASRLLEEADTIRAGEISLEVIHTPGHTPGGICLKYDNLIFTGDTLFKEGIGRTDLPYGSQSDLMNSIKKKLLVYGDEVTIYPGHGPQSTIGEEKRNNPFLK